MTTRKECVEALKHSVAKVRQYDEELADEILNCISDYELAWRGYFGGEDGN